LKETPDFMIDGSIKYANPSAGAHTLSGTARVPCGREKPKELYTNVYAGSSGDVASPAKRGKENQAASFTIAMPLKRQK
jgi:hypothetical protein